MACYDGFGNLADKRPFFTGDFNGDGKKEILFCYSGDGNWWLGSFNVNQLQWTLATNTGRPYRSRVRVHFKILTAPNVSTDTMLNAMRQVSADAVSRDSFVDDSPNCHDKLFPTPGHLSHERSDRTRIFSTRRPATDEPGASRLFVSVAPPVLKWIYGQRHKM